MTISYVLVLGIITVILVHFIFILVPLTLAYFLTFLLTPLMNVFEQRPLECRGKSCCNPKDIDRSGISIQSNNFYPEYIF